ncbi:zinc knuckle CX2CX4HX4C containing protein [Tanacetum coccineum]
MHSVPIVVYSKVGLDVIAAKVGKLIRLDAHSTSIYLNSWGRSEYARALVEISAESPLVNSVDVEIPLDEDNGHVMVKVDIEYEWQPPIYGTCKVFDHLEAVCPNKQAIYPKKSSATEDKGKQIAIKPVVNTGKKNTDKKVSTQHYIKGYRVNNPKTKLVYRAVVKPQTDNHVSNNMEQSLNTTKPPSPPDSSKDGKPNYISDDISFDDVRKFINKSIEEELILEYIGNNTKEGCSSGEIQDDKVSSKKPSSSMEVLNADSDTDVEEVFQPDDGMSFPTSSFGGGQQLEGEILDAYEDYEVQFEEHSSLYQEFCDQFDFKLKCRGKK